MSQETNKHLLFHDKKGGGFQVELDVVIKFVLKHLPRLVIFGGVGLFLGLLISFYGRGYAGSLTIVNPLLELPSLRSFHADFSKLAGEQLSFLEADSLEKPFYKIISQRQWWEKSVTPTFSITKSDLKDLTITPVVKGGSISYLTFQWVGKNQLDVEESLTKLVDFVWGGAVFISVRNLLSLYETKSFSAFSEIDATKLITQQKIDSLNVLITNLESLRKYSSAGGATLPQIRDVNLYSEAYMPINSQIIAKKVEIFNLQKVLNELKNDEDRYKFMSKFVEKSKPLILQYKNGYQIADELLELNEQLNESYKPQFSGVNNGYYAIREDLKRLQSQFLPSRSLDQGRRNPDIKRTFSLIPVLLGVLMGVGLGLIVSALPLRRWSQSAV